MVRVHLPKTIRPSAPTLVNARHPLAKDLVSFWAFDEKSGDLRDLSFSRDSATEVSGVPTRDGKFGRYREFDGSADHFTVDNGTQVFRQTGGFSLAFLLRRIGQTAGDYFYSEGSTSSDAPFMGLAVLSDNFRLWIRDDGGGDWYNYAGVDGVFDDTDWKSIVFTVPSVAGSALVYVDGALTITITEGGSFGDPTTLDRATIGALGRTSVGFHAQFDIALVAGWHRTLSAEDAKSIALDPWGLLRPQRFDVGLPTAAPAPTFPFELLPLPTPQFIPQPLRLRTRLPIEFLDVPLFSPALLPRPLQFVPQPLELPPRFPAELLEIPPVVPPFPAELLQPPPVRFIPQPLRLFPRLNTSLISLAGPISVCTAGTWSSAVPFVACDSFRIEISGPAADQVRISATLEFEE